MLQWIKQALQAERKVSSTVIIKGDNDYSKVKRIKEIMDRDGMPYCEVDLSAKGGNDLMACIDNLIKGPSQQDKYCLLRLPGVSEQGGLGSEQINPYEWPVQNQLSELVSLNKFKGFVILPANTAAISEFTTPALARKVAILSGLLD